jgi:hypothetical protein
MNRRDHAFRQEVLTRRRARLAMRAPKPTAPAVASAMTFVVVQTRQALQHAGAMGA